MNPTYENVKDAVINKDLIGKVKSEATSSGGSDLSDVQVKQIKDWKAFGYKEKIKGIKPQGKPWTQ